MTGERYQPGRPRMIVRRRREVVGERQPRTIITRERGVVERQRQAAHRAVRRPRIGRRLKFIAGAVVAVGALGAGTWWAFESPVLRVQDIEVTGTSQLPADLVASAAGLDGQSMFTADLAAAQQSIARMPLVASVHVERSWPNTVKVQVTERQPWGTWQQGGVAYTIDRQGVVLGIGGADTPAAVIKSSEPGSRVQGDRVDYQAVDSAAEIVAKLPQVLGTTVTEVAFVAGKGVQVTTADGQVAMLGDSSSIAYKLATWAAMAKEARAQRINYTTIDLRFGNRPVLR